MPEDVEFLQASQRQVAELRSTMQPLARKLAARLEQKRRHRRRGALDFRRTVRRSMSTGGAPAEPVFRHGRPAKPQLVVVADISGSVSAFAAFTLQLAYALRTEFAAVRCFVFVDGVDEVTQVLAESDDIATATRRINSEGGGVWLDGRSDYGHALESFWERYGDQVRSRSTVIVLGDARNNYHALARRRPRGDPPPGRPPVLAEPGAVVRLGHRRLDHRRVRAALRRRPRVPQRPPAARLRGEPGLERHGRGGQTADRWCRGADAANGTKSPVAFSRCRSASSCAGTGGGPGSARRTCPSASA